MPVQSSEIRLQTRAGYDVHDVTEAVRAAVNTSGLARGTVTVFVTGSTGALTTVEYEPGLVQDLRELFDRIVPEGPPYHHDRRWHDGNGHAHVRASLVGPLADRAVRRGGFGRCGWPGPGNLAADHLSRL